MPIKNPQLSIRKAGDFSFILTFAGFSCFLSFLRYNTHNPKNSCIFLCI